ncbi:MAG: hypothetical protein AAGD18_26115 [Actinomycetota bacterium]
MRRVVVLVVVLGLLAACADDDGSSTEATDDPPATTAAADDTVAPAATPAPTTAAPAIAAPATAAPTTAATPTTAAVPSDEIELPAEIVDAVQFSVAGPYRAGVRTLETADGTPVEVWYPIDAATEGEGEVYSLAEWTPELVVAFIGEDRIPEVLSSAVRDAEPIDGRFPVAVFSHGFGGFRVQSAEITASLASWGFVVVAPDHDHRSLEAVLLGGVTEGDDVADLVAARDAVLAAPELGAVVANGRTVAFGHSAGARGSAEAVAALGAVAWVGMAPAGFPAGTDAVTTVIAGGDDALVDLAEVEAAAADADHVAVFADAGHQAFSDFCVLRGEPLPVLAAELNVPIPEELVLLATDGCEPGQLPSTQAAPAVEHLTVATFRAGLGIGDVEAPFAPDLLAEFADLGLEVRSAE